MVIIVYSWWARRLRTIRRRRADGTTDGPVQLAVGGTLATTLKDQRRVTFTRTRDGDYITAIEVKLDSENWDTNETTELQITFIDTTVPIPDSLVYPDNDTAMQPYAEYTFITESKTKRGSFTPLNPTSDDAGSPSTCQGWQY